MSTAITFCPQCFQFFVDTDPALNYCPRCGTGLGPEPKDEPLTLVHCPHCTRLFVQTEPARNICPFCLVYLAPEPNPPQRTNPDPARYSDRELPGREFDGIGPEPAPEWLTRMIAERQAKELAIPAPAPDFIYPDAPAEYFCCAACDCYYDSNIWVVCPRCNGDLHIAPARPRSVTLVGPYAVCHKFGYPINRRGCLVEWVGPRVVSPEDRYCIGYLAYELGSGPDPLPGNFADCYCTEYPEHSGAWLIGSVLFDRVARK